jgi:Tfp pilus assembly protein PilE
MKQFIKNLINKPTFGGDTIVEVMIAIGIAGFAIGSSYGIANNSLKTAINARERNDALNLMENQIALLKAHYEAIYPFNPSLFSSTYASNDTPPYPSASRNYCLIDATSAPVNNSFSGEAGANNLGAYNSQCVFTVSGTDYHTNIAAEKTTTSASLGGVDATSQTVFRVTTTWQPITQTGTGSNSQTVIYYRF